MVRIQYLDGYRGIAILLVIMFHAYSRWPELVPYGDDFGEFPLFRYGYLGVQLFFLISGFFILMTLERCDTCYRFLYRRWLRLFPAMLICSIVIYATAGIFVERPNGQPAFKDLIPGLSFIDPYIWLKVTGMQLSSLEGAFWSLYVEVKFYIIAAILYFLIGSIRLVYALFLCFMTWFSVEYLVHTDSMKLTSMLRSVTNILSFKYFGWFAAGAAYYLYVKTNIRKWFVFGVVFSLISAFIESEFRVKHFIAATLVSLVFAASILSTYLQSIISNRFFLYFGLVSYPLYLLHENMMISATVMLNDYTDVVPAYLFPVIAITLISTLSYFISQYIEPAVKRSILSGISKLQYLYLNSQTRRAR